MKYATARSLIRSGDLLGWTHRGWGTFYDLQIQLVRTATQSEYSHVGIAWVFGGRVFVIEAVGAGVRIFPLSRAATFDLVRLGVEWTETGEEYAMAQIGCPYSKWECLKAYFGPLEENGLWECAKLVIAIHKRLGVDLGVISTPSDVMRAALRRDGAVLIAVEA